MKMRPTSSGPRGSSRTSPSRTSSPSIVFTNTNGAPVAHACGLHAVGYGTGNRPTLRSNPANASGSRKSLNDETFDKDRVVVRPDRADVVADRIVPAV